MCFAGRRASLFCMILMFSLIPYAIVIASVPARAEEKKECTLSFALPEGTVLHYKWSSQESMNFSGVDVTMNQSADVDMSSAGLTEEGNRKIGLKFNKVTASMVMGAELEKREPPMKLEGITVYVILSPAGEIVAIKPGGNIAGMKDPEDLWNMIEPLFPAFPVGAIAVGGTWKQEIVRGKREGKEPAIQGAATYTLKKMEMKGSTELAVVAGKIAVTVNEESDKGRFTADGKGDIDDRIAVAGGHVVTAKQSIELRGHIVVKDPLTDKEQKTESVSTMNYEWKLQK